MGLANSSRLKSHERPAIPQPASKQLLAFASIGGDAVVTQLLVRLLAQKAVKIQQTVNFKQPIECSGAPRGEEQARILVPVCLRERSRCGRGSCFLCPSKTQHGSESTWCKQWQCSECQMLCQEIRAPQEKQAAQKHSRRLSPPSEPLLNSSSRRGAKSTHAHRELNHVQYLKPPQPSGLGIDAAVAYSSCGLTMFGRAVTS